jgi:hypothetical protein
MSADFTLGQKFYAQIEQLKPDNAQKLLALLSDSVGADEELASAFRLLFAKPVYVSLFLARVRPSAAELASLSSISSRCLSSALAARVHDFVSGYFALAVEDGSSSASNSSKPNQSVHARSVASFPASVRTPSVPDQEAATLFADEAALNEQDVSGVPPQAGVKPESSKRIGVPLKPIVLACAAILIVFASFKLPAICEPFGLCDKKSDASKDKKKESEPTVNSDVPNPEPEEPPAAVPADPPVSPMPPQVIDSPPQRPQAPVRSRPPAVTPPREAAPVREQPLW